MKYCSIALLCFAASNGSAQVLTNNGATASISPGTVVTGVGLENDSGTIINQGTAVLKDVTAQSGTTFTNKSLLAISGSMGGTGSITSDSATVIINGTTAQSIPAGFFTGNKVLNLTTSNAAGITLNGPLGIRNALLAYSGSFNANGYLTLLSDSNTTALIDGSGSGTITGNVTMQRYLASGFGYHYIGSPFQATKVAELGDDIPLSESFPNVFRYVEDTASNGWIKYNDTSNILYPLQGYAINTGFASDPKTIDLKGVVNNGSLSITLANHSRVNTQGFNLVGNPFPSPIDWKAPGGWTKTNIDDAIYYFDNGTMDRYKGSYSSHVNGISSDGKASNVIASMQGFFVHVKPTKTGTLQIDNDARVNNFTSLFHKETGNKDYPLVRLTAGYDDTSHLADPTVVYFDNAATDQFETVLDAIKMMNTDQRVPNFYSVSSDLNFAINAMPLPNESTKEIPLVLQLDKDGDIIFKATDIQNMPAGLHAYFADAERGVIQDIGLISTYKISLAKGSYDHRFYLLFSKQSYVSIPGAEELNAYAKGDGIVVTLTDDRGELMVTNTLGQLIHRETILGNGPHEVSFNTTAGVYIATMTTSKGKKSKKIFISAE